MPTHLDVHPHLIPRQVTRDERIPVSGVTHPCATVRFGTDPATPALDVDYKAHDLDNLHVADGETDAPQEGTATVPVRSRR